MATGNFTLSDRGYPTYALMAFDWVLENLPYELEGYDLGNVEEDEVTYWNNVEAAEKELINYYTSRYFSLPDFVDVEKAIEEANDEIKNLIDNTPLTREKELERRGSEKYLEDDYEGWTLYDVVYYEDYPEIRIEAGYYEGASIVIRNVDIDYISIYELGEGIANIMDKYFGEQGLGLGEIEVAYRFSSGETGYNIK